MGESSGRRALSRVAVTGATGFVGSYVVEELLNTVSCHVVCPVRPQSIDSPAAVHLKGLDATRVTVCQVEPLADPAGLASAFAGCDAVINCMGFYAWWVQARDEGKFQKVNLQGAEAVMTAARAAGVRMVVQVSTVLAYGVPPARGTADAPITADTPPAPAASRYAASKAAGDAAVARIAADGGPDACTCYLACCIGRDPKLLDAEKDVMRIAPLISGQVPATLGHSTTYTYVDVRDAAAAIVAAASRGRPAGRYLIGDQRLTTGEYYDLLARLSGVPAPRATVPVWLAAGWAAVASFVGRRITGRPPQAPPDLLRTVAGGSALFDATSSAAELGLEKYRSIEDAFREAVEYIRSGGA